MPRCDLDLWHLDLELLKHVDCHALKLCTKFERNRIIHRWVIDDLARFCSAISGNGTQLTELSQGCVDPTSPNLARHRATFVALHFCFRIRISCWIFKRWRLQFAGSFKRCLIRTFWPCKIREGVGEIPIPVVPALPTTEPPKYIWWPSCAWLLSTADQ